jgi:hypothetical protein
MVRAGVIRRLSAQFGDGSECCVRSRVLARAHQGHGLEIAGFLSAVLNKKNDNSRHWVQHGLEA